MRPFGVGCVALQAQWHWLLAQASSLHPVLVSYVGLAVYAAVNGLVDISAVYVESCTWAHSRPKLCVTFY
jgi:hypothetical protein